MDEIRLKITNTNNEAYKSIELRKFFYMAFIGEKGKTLDLYIATVFGGNLALANNQSEAGTKIQYDNQVDCSLCFQFSGGESYKLEDHTQSFCEQSDQVSVVWGKCTKINNQTELKQYLTTDYKDLYPEGTDAIKAIDKCDLNGNQPYYFGQRKTLSPFIAVPGKFESTSADESSYTLTGSSKWPDGLEAINWIKISITLSEGFTKKSKKSENQKKQLTFIVEFDGTYFSPDFTWYFAPPRGFVVCQDSKVIFDSKDVPNSLQSVSDYTTVEFSQWLKRPESILDRKKARILFPDEKKAEKLKPVTVSLQLENPHQHDNWQFFAGLLIAFLLAFCSDKTRINDYFTCLSRACTCGDSLCKCRSICNALTILIPILLLVLFLVVAMWPGRALSQNAKGGQKAINIICWICAYTALFATIILVVYIYLLWLVFPDLMSNILKISCHCNYSIIHWTYCLAIIPSLAYLIYCFAYLKCKITDYI